MLKEIFEFESTPRQIEKWSLIPWNGRSFFRYSTTYHFVTSKCFQNEIFSRFFDFKVHKTFFKAAYYVLIEKSLRKRIKIDKNQEKSPAIQPFYQNFYKKFKENCTQKDCCEREISTLTQINFFLSFLALKKMKYHVLRNKQQFNYITWIFHIIYFYIFLLFLQFYLYTHLVIIDKRRKAKKTLARKTNNFTYISHKFR